MRILELRFKNLNSLYGQWAIDFTRPEYVQDGIFVITGPTGAGKSTLLDGICLALYGKTPRLKSISQASNEIMSRQTGECFAEVTFETQSGQFKAHWSQHRARKQPGGNLVDSKHEISDAATGKILASKKRETANRVVKETGMDFDRFTRSMLLAQGGFAAFLQAGSNERAPILEQITGTEIYSQISIKVHERTSVENDKLKLLEARMGGVPVLNKEDEIVASQNLVETQKQEEKAQKQNEEFIVAIAWLNNMEHLKVELSQLDQAIKDVVKEQQVFEKDRDKLENALKAVEIESEYATLVAKREQQKTDLVSLESLKLMIPDLKKEFHLKQEILSEARKTLDQVKKDQKQQLVLIKNVRKTDLEIVQKQDAQKELQSECINIEAKISKERYGQQQIKEDQEKNNEMLARVNVYLSDYKADSDLIMVLAGIREKIERLSEKSKTIDTLKDQKDSFEQNLKKQAGQQKKQQAVCKSLKEKDDLIVLEIAQITKEMEVVLDGRSLKGYRSKHDGLLREMAYKRKIADLEAERVLLADGKACPLCGSLDHPFVSCLNADQVPKADETQKKIEALELIIQTLEDMEAKLQKVQEREKQAVVKQVDAQKQEKEGQYQTQRMMESVQRLEEQINLAREKKIQLNTAVMSALNPFDIELSAEQGFDTICQTLEKRVDAFKMHQDQKVQIEKQLNELATQIKHGEGILNTLGSSLEDKKAVLKTHEIVLKKLKDTRIKQYGNKDPDAEEIRLEIAVNRAQKSEINAAKRKDQISQQLVTQKARMVDLNVVTTARKPEIDKLEHVFSQDLVKFGFKDEQTFVTCRLSSDQKNSLARTAQLLDEKQRDIAVRKKDRKIQLEIQAAKKLTLVPMADLEIAKDQTQAVLKDLGETIGALKQKLSDNIEAKGLIESQIENITAQKKECSRWEELHRLIGSANGQKYRNFAQGITFELMVSHANKQLAKMSDRYLLVRDQEQPLELNIMDDYQAGEIRSIKNLSGGESFIVSLSLALGLSNMASGNVRVDSLFLDEGFGTLDEDALETALQALSGLHSSGKLIGIISHVPALKETINTQIQVTPVFGGKSYLNGPGCISVSIHLNQI